MSELGSKVKKSIERLKAFEPDEGYYFADSGGKDSTVCHALLEISGVKHDDHYRITSVDPPELIHFLRDNRPTTARELPRYADGSSKNMWNLIPKKKMPPTRIVRYCCSELKEDGGDGRMVITGVRWAESVNRAKNQGVVTVMEKTAYKEFGDNTDFMSTPRGGWY